MKPIIKSITLTRQAIAPIMDRTRTFWVGSEGLNVNDRIKFIADNNCFIVRMITYIEGDVFSFGD